MGSNQGRRGADERGRRGVGDPGGGSKCLCSIEPTEAMWMLCTRGWETWRRAHDAPVEIPA